MPSCHFAVDSRNEGDVAACDLGQVRMLEQEVWRKGSESNGVFTDYQPQCTDLQGDLNSNFTGLQWVFGTTRRLPALTRRLATAYSLIEEIVGGFVEDYGERRR